VLALFASRILNGKRPQVFEDGLQRRDLVSVHDIVGACALALSRTDLSNCAFNVGSGKPRTILDIADRVARVLGRPDLQPEVTGKFRVGDIRHCFADLTRAREQLGYTPQVTLEDGIAELGEWLRGQHAEDRSLQATSELAERGLTV
jgi:dTDP-L-rhamnose 4-epimerase